MRKAIRLTQTAILAIMLVAIPVVADDTELPDLGTAKNHEVEQEPSLTTAIAVSVLGFLAAYYLIQDHDQQPGTGGLTVACDAGCVAK